MSNSRRTPSPGQTLPQGQHHLPQRHAPAAPQHQTQHTQHPHPQPPGLPLHSTPPPHPTDEQRYAWRTNQPPGHFVPQAAGTWPAQQPAGASGPLAETTQRAHAHTRAHQYEFTAQENKLIDALSFWSGGLGVVKLVHGALSLVVFNLFGVLLHLAAGLLMLSASRSLKRVVTTQGNDIDHLLKSVEHIATVFQIRLILTLVVTLIGILFAAIAIMQ